MASVPRGAQTSTDTVAAFVAALANIPSRLASLEQQQAELIDVLEIVRAALPPRLVTATEAAAALGVSPATVRRWAKSGEIPSHQVRGTLRIDLRFVATNTRSKG